MKKKNINQSILLASLTICLASCGGPSKQSESHNVIAVESAYSNPTELKASDGFRKVRYVRLETTDSCLIGRGPVVQILGDRLIVSTRSQCLLFDKETGRFISSVGHPGNDPQGFSSALGWVNEAAGCIYLASSTNKQKYLIYNKEGKYMGDLMVPPKGEGFVPLTSYSYLDASTFVGHYMASKDASDRLVLFRDTTVLKTFDTHSEARMEKPIMTDNIMQISVTNHAKTGGSILIISYKDGETKDAFCMDNNFMWHVGKDLYFKENFNDTIYQVTPEGLRVNRIFDYGVYRWDGADRKNIEKDQCIFPTIIYENEKVIFFRFVINLYHTDKQIAYNGIFVKTTGEVKVAPYENAIQDDLTNFLPLQPTTMSANGEFAAIIPTEKVITWFEENAGKADLPDEIADLKGIGEEDNPVIVIME